MGGPGDNETKSVSAPAEAGTEVQDHRVWQNPERGWTIGKRRAPSSGPRQEIDRCIWIADEYTRGNKAGGIPPEIDAGQAGAGSERPVPNAGDAVADRDARQAGALDEREVPDAGDAVRDRDARQLLAVRECPAPDDGDTVRDRDARQLLAVIEREAPDVGDAVGDGDAGQAGADRERPVLDPGDAVGDGVTSSLGLRLTPRTAVRMESCSTKA